MSETPAQPRWIAALRWTGLVLLLALPLSVIVVRAGAWQPGLIIYALACLLSAVLLALVVILALLPKLRPRRGPLLNAALLALPGAVLLAVTLGGRGDHPPIHNISTDLEQPPTFARAPALRGSEANSLTYSEDTRAQQRSAYPDLGPLLTELAPEAAYERALDTARALGWEVTYEGNQKRSIEAVDTTRIMGFKDDIAIRLRPTGDGGTRIDLRSVSRVGVGDLGANAARIRAFQQQFRQAG